MPLSTRALTIVAALLWGGCLLFVGVANLLWPAYGIGFLRGMASVYPGFHASGTFADVIVGTIWGLADGAIGGAIFGWLYNMFREPAKG